MKISDLYAPHGPFVGQDVYIVGTGTSMRVFPMAFLYNKTCILLNDASRLLSLGPVSFSNNRRWIEPVTNPLIKYSIVKARFKSDPKPWHDDNHVKWDDPTYYAFSYRDRKWDNCSHLDREQLWKEPCHYWNFPDASVAVFACQFALLAGAATIFLVGCDCLALKDQHYFDKKLHKLKHQGKAGDGSHDYDAYAAGLMVMRQEALEKFGVPLLTLTPFCGLGREHQQFLEMDAINDGRIDQGQYRF